MRMPMQARSIVRLSTLVAASSLMLSACSNEATAPVPTEAAPPTLERSSSFQPTAAAKALFGVKDGTYAVTFDPSRDQSFALGPNHLDIPANSVCNLLTSGYGASYWNKPCAPEKLPVTLKVVIKNASSSKPSIEFYPAMRFNPTKNVQLFMYAPKVNQKDAKDWVMIYCPDKGKCLDEAVVDSDLKSYVDKKASVLFRRIKHFSGYVVAERGDEESEYSGR